MADYHLWTSDHLGQHTALLADFIKLDYARATNDVGVLTLVMPGTFDWRLCPVDSRIEVWRAVDGAPAVLETSTVWLVRGPLERTTTAAGERTVTIRAVSAVDLLRRRIVAYAAGTAYAKKTAAADDMLKTIVAENLGSSATDTARSLAAYLTIQDNSSAAPSLAKEFAYANVLKACQDIAQASAQAGTRLYFDVVAPTTNEATNLLEFRTYITQRGIDHGQTSQQPIVFSLAFGNLSAPSLSYDYAQEITAVYVGGQGQGDRRLTNYAEDTARSGRSVFGRRESFVSGLSTTDTTAAALLPEAQRALWAGKPRKKIKATLLDTPSAQYGKHFFWGDKVVLNVDGEVMDARIESIRVTVSDKKEVIDINVSADDDL